MGALASPGRGPFNLVRLFLMSKPLRRHSMARDACGERRLAGQTIGLVGEENTVSGRSRATGADPGKSQVFAEVF